MSALLRALMGQQTGVEKPNLAVIKDVTFAIDSQTGDTYLEARTGLTGVVTPKLPYRYVMDYDIDLTYADSTSWVTMGNRAQWGPIDSLLKQTTMVPGKNTGHIDVVVDNGRWDYGAGDTGHVRLYHRHCKGTVHLYNFRIEEA